MFNDKLINVLRQVNNITNSVILKYPTTVAISPEQDISMMIPISELDSDQFPEIALADKFDKFLNVFRLFPNETRTVTFNNNVIKIAEGKNSADFIVSDVALLDAFDKDASQFERTSSVPSVASFEMNVADIKQIRNAISVFKDLSDITFVSKDGELSIKLNTFSKFNNISDMYNINKDIKTEKDFDVTITVQNFLKIPLGDYRVDIKYNEKMNSYRLLMSNIDLENFKIMIARKV